LGVKLVTAIKPGEIPERAEVDFLGTADDVALARLD
jgi:hypothetical protein